MSDEKNYSFRKFAIQTLSIALGIYLGLSLFITCNRPPLMAPAMMQPIPPQPYMMVPPPMGMPPYNCPPAKP